jgi:hypothetical protein
MQAVVSLVAEDNASLINVVTGNYESRELCWCMYDFEIFNPELK